jgi:uncharacterized protein DUF5678
MDSKGSVPKLGHFQRLILLGVRIDGGRLRDSMATLEQIIEEVKRLPTEEKLRLRAALEQLTGNGDELSPYRTREDERAWLEAHGEEFLDQWVVLEADQLVAHGTDARIVYNEARAKGIDAPYLVHVTPKADPYVGGW